MKKLFIIYMRSFALVLLICASGYSQQNVQEKEIIGHWTVHFGRTVQNMAGQGKAKFDKMSEHARGAMRKSLENRSFEFEEDHVVNIRFLINENPQNLKGKWVYDATDNSLKITADGVTMSYLVEWGNSNIIRLILKDAPHDGLLKQFYLTRKN
jgi:hypothetical protein